MSEAEKSAQGVYGASGRARPKAEGEPHEVSRGFLSEQ